jgi:hypothetical protein
LQDYIARQRKQPPPHLPVDPAATDAAVTVTPPEEIVIDAHLPIDPAATDAATTVPPEEVVIDAEATTVSSSLLPGTATKRKKNRKRWNHISYQNKKN